MRKEDCFELGYIARPHGLDGTLLLVMDVDNPRHYENLDRLFLEVKGQIVPFFIECIDIKADKAYVKLEEINSEEKAIALKSCIVLLPLSDLPPLDDHQYYFHELIGYQVVDSRLGDLGTVSSMITLPQHDILSMDYLGKEVLIPATDSIMLKVDKQLRQVMTRLPEGLLEIYLDDNAGSEDETDDDDNLS